MKKYIITYKDFILKVHISQNNTTILNSYKVKKSLNMKSILYKLSTRVDEDYDIARKRTIPSLIREWRVHNLCYSLGILRSRSKDVDFEAKQSWYMRVLYFLISPLYLHFS